MVNSCIYNTLFGSKKQKGGFIGLKQFQSADFLKLFNEKKQFLLLVFSNLITQLGITYYIMMNHSDKIPSFTILFVSQIIILLLLSFVPMPSFIKFILFSIFSLLFGLFLSGLNKRVANKDIIQIALLGTLSIFGLMFFIGALLIAFGIQLGIKFAMGLFFSLLFLIIVRLIMLFSSTLYGFSQLFSAVGILLFSLYILYDTNNILQRNYSGDFITASLDYYLDIINIFINLVNYNN